MVPAPKIMKGTLVDGKYTAMDESFSVNSPFPEGGHEYTYTKIMERYSDFENQIAFSSSAAPTEVYRVHIYKDIEYQKLDISAGEELEEHLLSMAIDIFESAYDTPLIQQDSETKSIGNLKADSHLFLQKIPERGGGILNRFMKARAFTAWHSSYFIEYGNNVAFIWVNRPVVTDDSDSTLVGYVSAAEK